MKSTQSRLALVAALAGSSSAFTHVQQHPVSGATALFNGLGAGGMADTRNPEESNSDDSRKSISAAPSFEEYLKMRDSGGGGGASAAGPPVSGPATVSQSTGLTSGGMDVSGNTWKPDSEKMGSTDTGDFFPEGYNADDEIEFSSGMMGSQANLGGRDAGPQLPGLENLGEDAMVAGGLELDSDIPADMEFVASSVPDGTHEFNVASTGTGEGITIEVKPVCMTFEDYYAAFTKDSHPSFSVSPSIGRMDRRGGETTLLDITCTPNGNAGDLTGDLVINLPEDNSKICFKIIAKSF